MSANERPIPDAALRDANAVEMLRVWIAERGLHCSMKIGMYRETTQIAEQKAWGKILADVARHVSNALETAYSISNQESLEAIQHSFVEELAAPTTGTKGGFVKRH